MTDRNGEKMTGNHDHAVKEVGAQMPGGFFIYEAAENGKITYVNHTLLQIYGCQTKEEFWELTGGTFEGMVHPEDLEEVLHSIASQITATSQLDHVMYRIIRKNGEIRWVDDYGKLGTGSDGKEFFYVFITDITEKKLMSSNSAVYEYMQQLNSIFDIVRLVDVSEMTQYTLTPNGELKTAACKCFSVWNKETRCDNCISAKVFATKKQMTKFEFIGNEPYHVTAKYIEIEGRPFILEMVYKETDKTLLGVYGKKGFADTIKDYNRKLYIDTLTGAYNRAYFEEQLKSLTGVAAIAMLDLDYFKSINDTCGHQAGDEALKLFVRTIKSCIRKEDMLVRFGGDEFILIFKTITKDALTECMENIRSKVYSAKCEVCPEIQLSISAGVVWTQDCSDEVIGWADQMLYKAKEKRNCVEISFEQ